MLMCSNRTVSLFWTRRPSASSSGMGLRGDDLPNVVGVVVGVAGDLLTLTRDAAVVLLERISFQMRVEEDLGVLVDEGDLVIVLNVTSTAEHVVALERLLKLGAHEGIAGTALDEDGKVDPEPEEVETPNGRMMRAKKRAKSDERHARSRDPFDVEQLPEIPSDGATDGHEK